MELKGRVALVTGGTGGLGAVIARQLVAEGVQVALTYLAQRDAGQQMCDELQRAGGKALLVHLDQTDPASCVAAVEATVHAFGRLDILINNAAINKPVPFSDLDGLTPEIWDDLLSTNLRGPFLLARAAAVHLKRQDQARVVNVAGFAGLAPVWGARPPLIVGPAITAAGFIVLSVSGTNASYWRGFLPGLVIIALGMTITVAPLTTTVLNAAPDDQSGTASGINNAAARTGSLLAVAGLGLAVGDTASNRTDSESLTHAYRLVMLCAAALAALSALTALLTIRAIPMARSAADQQPR